MTYKTTIMLIYNWIQLFSYTSLSLSLKSEIRNMYSDLDEILVEHEKYFFLMNKNNLHFKSAKQDFLFSTMKKLG